MPNMSTNGQFILRDLPGSGNRVDILCRSLQACFDWGPVFWSKSKLEFLAVIANEVVLRFRNPSHPHEMGEVWWASAIQDSLKGEPPPFVDFNNAGLRETLEEIVEHSSSVIYALDERGNMISDWAPYGSASQNSFMLGDHHGFDFNTQTVMKDLGISRISLGVTSYLGSHCVGTIISKLEGVEQENEHG
ncbi:MAG: hypothetical protein ACXACE_02390 [Candidatus Thorarchaeota archaeon]|jgi:tRNA (pseudouridine54-N1)-methyltransferase